MEPHKGNHLAYESQHQQQQTALPPHQLHPLRIRSSIRKLILRLRAFVRPFQTRSILKGGSAPLGICPSSNLIASSAPEPSPEPQQQRRDFSPPTHTHTHAVDLFLFRRDAGWCLCGGVECDSPVETLQFYFRPSHTQWEPRQKCVAP